MGFLCVKIGSVKSRVLVALLAAALCATGCSRGPSASSQVTFNKDIAPILFANCASCHRSGEVAPFPLLTYADAVKHADKIAEQTSARQMPPWLPEPGEFPILGERRLRDDQIEAIQRWVKEGKAEGRAADLPKRPEWPEGWQLGTPDAIITTARPFNLNPSKDDVYRNLVLHTSLKGDVFVRAVEFKTGGAPIHHAVIRVDKTAASRRRDGADGQPGFDGMSWQNVQDPDGQFIGWAPGRGPILSPDGIPWRLDHDADLVVELHVIPSRKPLVIQPTIGLFLSRTPPVQTPLTVKMGSKSIDIPAGKSDYVVTDTYQLPVAVDLMSVYPHAHYLGKEMEVTATLPGGAVKTLLHIKQWSFHWQQDYRYATPIPLPPGTTLTMRYVYDNSDKNDENPRHPPVRVRLGPKSTDEMAELGLQVMPKSTADAAQLAQAFDERDMLANVALGEARVREAPDLVENRAFLGGAYVEAGRFPEAIPQLEAALRLDERSASAHSDLGTALMAQGNLAGAIGHLQRAAALQPRDESMQFNLGNALNRLSRTAEAAAAYQRALSINPEFPDAHVNLGTLLFAHGRVKDALPHFQRAVELMPNSAVIHSDLGSALAGSGRYAEALKEFRRAIALNPEYLPALENIQRLERMGIR
jgi:tetratricopeptide (TPR) repeat protein/mono/diheme cytochrome c family protein